MLDDMGDGAVSRLGPGPMLPDEVGAGEEYDRAGGEGTLGEDELEVEKVERAEYNIRISSAEGLSIGSKAVVPFMIPSMIFLESEGLRSSIISSMSSEALLTG
jgi:hypothetical protein